LKYRRQRFQRGSLRKVARANNQWAWEYRYKDPATDKDTSMYLSAEKFPTEIAVTRHLEAFVLKLNSENPTLAILEPTFNAVLDRFIEEEKLLEIKQRRPGDRCDAEGELRYSTVSSYLSVIKQTSSSTRSSNCCRNRTGRWWWWRNVPASGQKRCWRSNGRTSTSRT
jgi:hypothetical protein